MTVIRTIVALVLGFILGGAVNMGLVMLGPAVIPPPPGVDMADPQSLTASVHLLQPQHFLFPFLAHALGTLAGATVAFCIAATHRRSLAYLIGVIFLAGGIAAATMIPAPLWFIALDLIVAYIPMAWLATLIGARLTGRS